MYILALNPGGNSLKAEIISCASDQRFAFDGVKLLSVTIEGIGHDAKLTRYQGKKDFGSQPIKATSYGQAAESLLEWLASGAAEVSPGLNDIECVGVRVVHGGPDLTSPTRIDSEVERQIIELEKLAPLHNKSSIELLAPVRQRFPKTPILAVFDTAFHRTIPDHASLYAIPLELSHKHHIRRYGFHGISHRYLLERYAFLAGKSLDQCNLVTMHLESGCSLTAIREGISIDNTMGLTPLEGLMMGTRSGDIDPSIIPLLVREEGMQLDDVMAMLNKKSGLLGVSGESLDTRVLMQSYDSNPRVKLAIEMFSYRVRKAVGGYLAVVGAPQAVVFGGGIAENNSLMRERVASGLRSFGFEVDEGANQSVIDTEGRITTDTSPLQGWVIPAEEGLQIGHECYMALGGSTYAAK